MSDTGEELARDMAHGIEAAATRAIDHALFQARLEARQRALQQQNPTDDELNAPPTRIIELHVLPPLDADLDERASMLQHALDEEGVLYEIETMGDAHRLTLHLYAMTTREARSAQRALEALQADPTNTFTLGEVTGYSILERRCNRASDRLPEPLDIEKDLIRDEGSHEVEPKAPVVVAGDSELAEEISPADVAPIEPDATYTEVAAYEDAPEFESIPEPIYEPDAEPLPQPVLEPMPEKVSARTVHVPREHVMVIFATNPDRDLEDAQAYVQAMAERGYEPWHAAMGTMRGVHHTIELSYPADERERFADDHVDALCAIGILDSLEVAPELDVLEEPLYHPLTLEELVEARLDARKHEAERSQDAPAQELDAHSAPELGDATEPPSHEHLTARDYLTLPAREKAKVAPERIPAGAFRSSTLPEVSRGARDTARMLSQERDIMPTRELEGRWR